MYMDAINVQKLYQSVLRQRRKKIVKLREQGKTLEEIAARMDISKQRVWSILESLNKLT